MLTSPRKGNLREKRIAGLGHVAVIIKEVVSPRRGTCLQMQQMLQCLVDVKSGDESASVELGVDEQLWEALFEPLGQ